MPRLWLLYLSIFNHPLCPSLLSHSHARHTFDRALRTLPPSLHHRIWVRYLLWAEKQGGPTTVTVYRRYLAVDPSITERYTALLLAESNPTPRPLEAAKLLLSLARKAARGEYTSPEGKSPYQLLGEFIEVVESHAEQLGIDVDATIEAEKMDEAKEEALAQAAVAPAPEPASVTGELVRFAGPPIAVDADGKPATPYDEDEDPTSSRLLNVERIITQDGLAVYKDQAGRLWTGIATYWLKRGEFARATATFEAGLASVLTIRDFTQIFDAYAEFSESLVSALMEGLAEPDEDESEEDVREAEAELDRKMKEFEELMDRRPFLVNDVLIRRNPNDVQEWEKRVALWGEDDVKVCYRTYHTIVMLINMQVAETYTKALETINPKRATANFFRLYVNFAKFYEEGGVARTAEPDLPTARKILEKATKVNFKTVEDLAEIWCEWAEMEIRAEYALMALPTIPTDYFFPLFFYRNYDEAIRVMQRGAAIPRNTKINYHDPVRSSDHSDERWVLSNHPVPSRPSSAVQIAKAVVLLRGPRRVSRNGRLDKGGVRQDPRAEDRERSDHRQLRRVLGGEQVFRGVLQGV
jgi:pre-mRNA-splicing factor SYF1